MLKTLNIDEQISEYYDNEMNHSKLIHFEAKMQTVKHFRDHIENETFQYFKISNSIKLVKIRCQNKSKALIEEILKSEALIDINTIFFKRIDKLLRYLFLHFNRHNP